MWNVVSWLSSFTSLQYKFKKKKMGENVKVQICAVVTQVAVQLLAWLLPQAELSNGDLMLVLFCLL